MIKQELSTNDYNDYHSLYINLLSNDLDLVQGFKDNSAVVIDFFSSIPNDKLEYRYAENKWTIKEILLHIIDTERIFMYRFLRIARNDNTPLAGFEQNGYIEPSEAHTKSINQLIEEFKFMRLGSISLVQSISEKNLRYRGAIDNDTISSGACAFLTLGHSLWHINIIKERYL